MPGPRDVALNRSSALASRPLARVLIVTDVLSRTVSELSQLIVQILDTAFLILSPPPWGLRDNVRCSSWVHWKARSGLPISVKKSVP